MRLALRCEISISSDKRLKGNFKLKCNIALQYKQDLDTGKQGHSQTEYI